MSELAWAQAALIASEGKAFANFVARARGAEKALKQQELVSRKRSEVWLTAQFSLEILENHPSWLALGARKGDVRLVEVKLRQKSAKPSKSKN